MLQRKTNVEKTYELVNFCEFDKFAEKSYCAVHDVDSALNLGDITKVDETKLKHFNMICGGSPCQDFSVAGQQAGSRWECKHCVDDDGNPYEWNPLIVHYSQRDKCPKCGSTDIDKSRSSLLVEWLRIIRANKPMWGIYENVKNIVGKRFKETFDMFIDELHEYGYNTYYKVLNAKDYGVPQNRERVYLIIIKKDFDNGKFTFPEGFDNGLRLKDILEDEVDEKFYINTPKAKELIDDLILSGKLNKDVSNTVRVGGQRLDRSTSMGSDTSKQGVIVSNQCGLFNRFTDTACTLMARDYKGLGNQAGNGVITYERTKRHE